MPNDAIHNLFVSESMPRPSTNVKEVICIQPRHSRVFAWLKENFDGFFNIVFRHGYA